MQTTQALKGLIQGTAFGRALASLVPESSAQRVWDGVATNRIERVTQFPSPANEGAVVILVKDGKQVPYVFLSGTWEALDTLNDSGSGGINAETDPIALPRVVMLEDKFPIGSADISDGAVTLDKLSDEVKGGLGGASSEAISAIAAKGGTITQGGRTAVAFGQFYTWQIAVDNQEADQATIVDLAANQPEPGQRFVIALGHSNTTAARPFKNLYLRASVGSAPFSLIGPSVRQQSGSNTSGAFDYIIRMSAQTADDTRVTRAVITFEAMGDNASQVLVTVTNNFL